MAKPLSSPRDMTNDEREGARLLCIDAGLDEDALTDYSELIADAGTAHTRMVQREDLLLSLGYPIAAPYGDDVPEIPDETQDVPELAIANIQIAQLARYLEEMNPQIRRVIKMFHGVFGTHQCNQPQIATRLGISVWKVRELCDEGLAELRARFGVEDELDAVRRLLTEMAHAA